MRAPNPNLHQETSYERKDRKGHHRSLPSEMDQHFFPEQFNFNVTCFKILLSNLSPIRTRQMMAWRHLLLVRQCSARTDSRFRFQKLISNRWLFPNEWRCTYVDLIIFDFVNYTRIVYIYMWTAQRVEQKNQDVSAVDQKEISLNLTSLTFIFFDKNLLNSNQRRQPRLGNSIS